MLGRSRGIRIGEEPDRDGQYYHYLAMWLFALWRLGPLRPKYHERAIDLARTIHPRFVIPGVGVQWKVLEDLSGPYLPYGLGALAPFHGLVVYACSTRTPFPAKSHRWNNSSRNRIDGCK